jgi:hypothetical protein
MAAGVRRAIKMRIVGAAVLYFLIVYAVGFVLGPIRVYSLEPRLGETVATLCEAPFIIVAVMFAARKIPPRLNLAGNVKSLALMGFAALVLQQSADFALGAFARGIPPAQQINHLTTPAGLIYLVLLVTFAAMPVLINWRSGRLPSHRA